MSPEPLGSRPTRQQGRWRSPSSWSMRTRLVAAMVALLAVVSMVIGLVSVLALRQFLADRLDDQLYAAAHRSAAFGGGPGGAERPPGERGLGFLLAPGQAEGTLGALVQGGEVTSAAVLDPTGTAEPLTADAVDELAQVPVGTTMTVDLGDNYGDYRVLASTASDGYVLVTGLPLSGVDATTVRLAAIVTLVAAVGLALAAFVAMRIVRWSLRPLHRVATTATRVSELRLDRGEVALAERVPSQDADPDTEVGQVGAALNRMLDHIAAALSARQHSEMRVRQFVADASHELRTPLASIRGYAELTRRSTEPVPADVAHALGRVESEAVRMTGLVDDLLLLARLDSGRPVERAPVDLSRLVVDATSDARVAGKNHRWDLDVPAEPVVVDGDEAGLHQVVANLLANARTHTPAGTHVQVQLRSLPSEVALSVTDDGPEIPDALLPDVFDRFARGDASRSRAAGSTGLGLSIVAAVVEAHGGHVGVDSRPGQTQFTVRLPLPTDAPAMPTTSTTVDEQQPHTVDTVPTRTVSA